MAVQIQGLFNELEKVAQYLKSPTYTFPIMATVHHNSSGFDIESKIGVHWDGGKENPK